MAINRYTKLTASEYDPLSLEEQIMVPLAKQKQQEDLLDSRDAIEVELNNLKRLQQDDPFVSEQTKKYKNQLDSVAQSIADEGINRETSRNFRKLYSNYKYDISDSGDLGRAQNNYLLAKEREKEARMSLTKDGHSQDKVDQLIQQGYANFQGTIGEDGERNEFGNFGGPGFYDYRKEAIDIMSRAKSSGFSIGKAGSDIEFVTDPISGATMARVTNTALTKEEKSNAEQIASAYNSMVTSYEYGDRKEFAELYGLTPDKLNKEFLEMSGAFKSEFTKNIEDVRTSLQNVGKAGGKGSVTESPSGEIWENIPVGARSSEPTERLGNRLTSDENLLFRNTQIGFSSGPISDFRVGLPPEELSKLPENERTPGANRKGSGSTTIDGKVLEQIFMDPNFLIDPSIEDIKAGARGAGIFDPQSGNNLTVVAGSGSLGKEQLAIQGTYNGKDYNLTIRDPNIVRAFDKYGTTQQGKVQYSKELLERRRLINNLRESDEFLQMRNNDGSYMYSDLDLAEAYENAIASRSDYFQTGYKPKNVQNSYYSQSEDLFGKGANLGTVSTRKVRLFSEDGTVLFPDMKDRDSKDILANMIMGDDWDDLEIKEREEVIKQLNASTDYGLQVGDHEFVNPMRRSITDRKGNEIFFMIENNNEISGKNQEFQGINDSSELQKYLIAGNPFVNKGKQQIRKADGTSVEANQWFIHVPRQEADGTMTITPLVVYGRGEYDSLPDLLKDIDLETLKPLNGAALRIEDQVQVDSRVKTILNRYYDKVADAKTTHTEARKRETP